MDLWKPTDLQLYHILARHRGWLHEQYQIELIHDEYLDRINPDWRPEARNHPEPANLCVADLVDAHLVGAGLEHAHLEGAHLSVAHLEGAHLRVAHLEGAVLYGAHLEHADLRVAHLVDAVLTFAHLEDARLEGAQVSKATLAYADLTGAIYAPASEPPAPYVAGIRGLSMLHLPPGEEIGLVQLRKLFQDGGLRDLEREATYAIERSATTALFASAPIPLQQLLCRFGFIDGTQIGLCRHTLRGDSPSTSDRSSA
jgi:hypothetical protein